MMSWILSHEHMVSISKDGVLFHFDRRWIDIPAVLCDAGSPPFLPNTTPVKLLLTKWKRDLLYNYGFPRLEERYCHELV